jgi:hypothetical protein
LNGWDLGEYMYNNISVLAGSKALEIIKDEGFSLDRVKVLVGASGAAKFLVLTGIDRVLMNLLKERTEKLQLIGSSIGSFRMSAYIQKDPIKALNILEDEYINQTYCSNKPNKKDITDKSMEIINSYISDDSLNYMVNHPFMTISFLVAKSKYFLKFENNIVQLSNLILAALSNIINRKNLKYFFERALFSSKSDNFNFNDDFNVSNFKLDEGNFKKALLASGSIPLVMEGVNDIKNAKGMFRDGGMIDYHLDFPLLPENDEGLVLYPHFYEDVTPSWFDKFSKRRARSENLKNTIIIAPSKEFVSSLPYQKIPDRKDFKTFSNEERLKYWNKVIQENKKMGDDLSEVILSGKIREIVKPI